MITNFNLFENAEIWNDFFDKVESGELPKDPADIENIEKMNIPPGGDVLSVSVGYGNHVEYFIDNGYQVTGTDISDKAIDSMREKYPDHGWLVHDTENTFPFRENMFDGIFARLTLHYFSKESIDKILENLNQILKPYGTIFIMVKVTNIGKTETGKKQYTTDEWSEMISKHFKITDSKNSMKLTYSFEKSESNIFEIFAKKINYYEDI